jgi:hypothetical protein
MVKNNGIALMEYLYQINSLKDKCSTLSSSSLSFYVLACRRGHDHMAVGFTTTYAIGAHHH